MTSYHDAPCDTFYTAIHSGTSDVNSRKICHSELMKQ